MKSIAEIKSGLHHFVAHTDDLNTLKKLQHYVQGMMGEEDHIVAFTAKGLPLNREAYKADIDKAIAEAKEGELISVEDIEKEL